MELLTRYRFLFLFLVGGILTVTAGTVIWNQKKGPYLEALYERSSFILLDDQNNFYGTKDIKEGERLFLVFVPDAIESRYIGELHKFAGDLDILRSKKIAVALVARLPPDSIRNLKRLAQFPGRALLDPSGSLGRVTGIWPDMEPVRTWGYVMIDKNLHVLWAARADHLLSFAEYQQKL